MIKNLKEVNELSELIKKEFGFKKYESKDDLNNIVFVNKELTIAIFSYEILLEKIQQFLSKIFIFMQ